MVAAAATYFAEHGVDGSVRDLARELGVDKALIYRHFGSKDALVAEALEHVFETNQTYADIGVDDRPIRDILFERYVRLASQDGAMPIQLVMRAALAGVEWPNHERFTQTGGFLFTLVAHLRAEAHLPSLDDVPLMIGEREFVMTLHGSLVYLAIRRHILRVTMPDDVRDVVAFYIDSFLASAPDTLRRLHYRDEGALTTAFFA